MSVEATAGRVIRIAYATRERTGSWESAGLDDYFDGSNMEADLVSVIVASFDESFATKVRPPRS